MKQRKIWFFIPFFLFLMISIFGITVSATYYEPNGTSSVEFLCDTSEVNRTLIVRCVDESGNLIKEVTYRCKHGDDDLISLSLYGYDIVGFDSDQGLWETCKLTWTSGTGICTNAYIQIRYYFRTALSKKTMTATVTLRKSESIDLIVRHYTQKSPGSRNYSLYSTESTKTIDYYDYISTNRKTITGYDLKEGYQSSISGNFSWTWVGKYKNMPSSPRCYSYNYINTPWSEDMGEYSTYKESKDGKLDYCINRVCYIDYYYDIKEYTISYHANGGTGAPETQTKYYGYDLSLSDIVPTRSGYTFAGWGTYASDATPNYEPGTVYTINVSIKLYAIWEPDVKTYTVSYNANGGYGAPVAQVKTHDVPLRLAYGEPYRTGYTFLGWGLSSSSTAPAFMPGDMFDKNRNVTLYAVWQSNAPVTHKVTFNANGGSAAPPTVTVVRGENLTLAKEPTRFNYRFLGWNTYPTASVPVYVTGGTIMAITKDMVLYAVWEYDPVSYTVIYNANGGSGAPPAQTKFYGIGITLSDVTPKRDGYDFLGWAQSSTATVAQYAPGDSYTSNANLSLYAVWQKTNYDFSVSDLSVSDDEPYRYGQITVKVKADSWDKRNSYTDIPLQLYYDNQLMSTQYVDFAAYGVANLTFTLYVGDTAGNRPIEARINWANRGNETNTGNNSVSTSIHVKDFDYEMSVDNIIMSDSYCAGETVISSFMVRNDSDYNITPDMRNTAVFTAYYYNGTQKVVIATDTWNNVVIPSGKANLVYFKWTVPTNLVGKTVYCECTINSDNTVNEENGDNNTAVFHTTVVSPAESQTPNTRYESTAPGSFKGDNAPANSTEQSTWMMWVYENDRFVLKSYGVLISSASPVITPSSDCKTAVYENGKWTIRSGYGFSISYTPTVTAVSGYSDPGRNAYTDVQSVYAAFPEFNYSSTTGNCRTLEYADGKWQFVQNDNAVDNERIHFIPVWFADGNYTVSATASRVWTPAGVISATRTTNAFTIDGSIFDDYYVGS